MHRTFARPRMRATCILFLIVLACDGGSGGGPTEPGSLTLEPARSEYAAFTMARVTVRGAVLTAASYPGTLGTAALTAERSSDSTVVFRVPELAAGEYPLVLTIGRQTGETTLGVLAAPVLDDPAAYVADVDSVLLLEVEELEDWYGAQDPTLGRFLDATGFAADIAMMRSTLAELQADFQALSAAEQREIAMTIQAYRMSDDTTTSAAEFASFAMQDEEFPACQWPEVHTVEEMRTCRRQHRDAMETRAKTVEQCDIDFNAQWEEGKYADAVGKNYIAYQCLKARMLKFKRDVAETVRAAIFGEFAGETIDSQLLAPSDIETDPRFPFVSAASRAYEPPVQFRNLHAGDVGRLAEASELATVMQGYQEAWDELNAAFPRPFVQSPPWLHQLHEANAVLLQYDRADLRIGRIEPASVTGEAEIADGEWRPRFTGPASTVDPTLDFSFEVIYDNGEFGADTVEVRSELLVHPLGGTWDAEMSLQVSEWERLPDDRILTEEGACIGDVELTGERVNTQAPMQTDTLRFGSSDNLFCDNYDGSANDIVSVPMFRVYDPADPYDFDDLEHTGSLAVDGQSVQITGERIYSLYGTTYSTTTTSITGTLVDGRLEGTYEYIDDRGENGRLEATGTFVAIKRR